MDPTPFVRGAPFPPTSRVPYPRAKPGDRRLPRDTWTMACIPAGVRLELAGDAQAVEITYETGADDTGWQGDAGRCFSAWRAGVEIATGPAVLGAGTARVALGGGDGPVTIHLPERMRPVVTSLEPIGGTIEPAAAGPRWLCYGDSIAEGWVASAPARSWTAVAARAHGLDVVNMGYAGAARGELASAEHLAELSADVISIAHGTNCWVATPFTPGLFRETLDAFLDVVRQGHPETPIVVVSPIVRPQAEDTPNRLGASLADLRKVMEEVVRARIDGGDLALRLIEGLDLLDPSLLADGVHPNDDGHATLAAAIGPVVAREVS